MRRLRVLFKKGEEVRYISHLDLMRTWERILRRAGVKPAHSHGFNPRPRLVFAAPLAVGATSDAEILDVVLDEDMPVDDFLARVTAALPPGIAVTNAVEVPLDAPSIMAAVLSSDYLVEVDASTDVTHVLAGFLARESVPYDRLRKGAVKQGDIRPAVLDLWPEISASGQAFLGMRLRLDVEGQTVRPEEVVVALNPAWSVKRVHRTALRLKDERQHEHAA